MSIFPAFAIPVFAMALLAGSPCRADNPSEWDLTGRPLPMPDFFQPRLDQDLPAYVPRRDVPISGNLRIGTFNVLPGLIAQWIATFQRYHPDVKIEVPKPYAGSVTGDWIAGKLDAALISRELKPGDVTAFQKKFGYAPSSVPVCGGSYRHYGFLDAITIIVNKDNPIERLDFDQLDAVFSRTRHRGYTKPVATWGDLGLTGEWADKPVHVWALEPWNGFEEFVRLRILSPGGKRGEWRDDINFVKEVIMPLPLEVAADRYAIGYSGMAFITNSTKPVAVAERPDGPYLKPTYKNVALATYPLSRLVYANVNKRPGLPLDPALSEFLRFILSREGQQLVLDQGVFLPLRSGQAAEARQML